MKMKVKIKILVSFCLIGIIMTMPKYVIGGNDNDNVNEEKEGELLGDGNVNIIRKEEIDQVVVKKDDLIRVIREGADNILRTPIEDMTAYLGPNFIAQYYLAATWLGWINQSILNSDLLIEILKRDQISDGSWQNVVDRNIDTGGLDFTIFNYWGLKAMGEPMDSEVMIKARQYILSKGGLDQSTAMTKVWLSLFGNYDWNMLFSIPPFIFDDSWWNLFYVENIVSQWVYPHLIPMTYLIDGHVTKVLRDHKFLLMELFDPLSKTPAEIGKYVFELEEFELRKKSYKLPSSSILNLIEKMFEVRQPAGSFGAYTVSTLFTIMCLQDFGSKYDMFHERISQAEEAAFNFIEKCYFESGKSSYLGVLDHGEYWDIMLTRTALLEAGVPISDVYEDGVVIAMKQQENGGIPFGTDFEYCPDTDDTQAAIIFLNKLGGFETNITKAVKWLFEMQNDDGGFGAFHKNRGGDGLLGYLVNWLASDFGDSAAIFDYSSVDLTAHNLEAWGDIGYDFDNENVRKGIQYIRNEQENFGGFRGRWGVNYIYATGAALVGLSRVCVDFDQKWIQDSIQWLISIQNSDGGFGETTGSDKDISLAGSGISTHSQTAWALMGLLEAEIAGVDCSEICDRAAAFLVDEFMKNDKWEDVSSVGTGHPGILYMHYPSYSFSFPLMALSRYLEHRHDIQAAYIINKN